MWRSVLIPVLCGIMVIMNAPGSGAEAGYDAVVLADGPVAYWSMGGPGSGGEADLTGNGHSGSYAGTPDAVVLPNGELAADFDGVSQYLEVGDALELSVPATGVLSIEAWLRPDTLVFSHAEGTGYVHWLGKGESGTQEYVARMYSQDNTEGRANRISGYAFNPGGGLGAGSYFQDDVTAGEWIHYVLVINTVDVGGSFPNGYTKLFKNGVQRAQKDLSINGVVITPEHGTAPLRVGSRDLKSFFAGAVGKVAVYGRELDADAVQRHYAAMTSP